MANELKTTLDLDIKPFLDALKRVATQVQSLEEIRPKFNTQEFQKIQAEILRFKPEVNVAVNVDKKSLDAVQEEINATGQEPIDLQILINSEEIQRSINRVQELRSTVLTIPKVTNINIDSNTEEAINSLDLLEQTARKIAGVDFVPGGAKLSAEELAVAFQFLDEDLKRIGKTINDIPDLTISTEGLRIANEFIDKTSKSLFELNKQKISSIFPNIEKESNRVLLGAAAFNNLAESIEYVQRKATEGLVVNLKIDETAKKRLLDLEQTIKSTPTTKSTKVDIIGEENVIKQANLIEKEIRDIPTSRNINVNIDKNAVSKISSATGAVSGFGKQLSSGLLASFSGAAIGAAVANFTIQAVRSIGTAIKTADKLSDSLRLAFTQVGVQDLEGALQRANIFALDLSTNFGISAETSKTLLAQVVGLTGEFGTASENITKAAIGIEAATGGLVKAEQAAKLFSRSLGNPEDQAALETLAKRFPALGDAINSTTEPAERANAVLLNLSGTFAALNADSTDLFSTLQRLGDTFSNVFGTAFAPIADAIAPTFQAISDSLLGSSETIGGFGEDIVNKFINPLIEQFNRIGPFFDKFVAGFSPLIQIVGSISFDILITSLQVLAPLLGAVGDILLALSPLFKQLGDLVSAILTPVFKLFNNELYNSLDPTKQLTDNVFSLNPLIETLGNVVSLLYPLINGVGRLIIDLLIPALQGLEYTLGIVLLPFRALNFAFDVGKRFIADYGDSIGTLAKQIQAFLILIPPLFIATKVLGALSDYASKPLNFKTDLGDLSKIGDIPLDAFGEQFDAAENLNQQFNIKLPKAVRTYTGAIKSGGKAASETIEKTQSELEKQLQAYEQLAKIIENRYTLETNQNKLLEAVTEKRLGRELSDSEKLKQQQKEVVALKEKQVGLEKSLADAFGISADNIAKFGQEYIKTGDLSGLPIKFNPKDQKSVDEAKKVAEQFVKLVNDRITVQTLETQYDFNISRVNFQLDRDAITTQVDFVQEQINAVFAGLQINDVAIGSFDATQLDIFRRNLEDLKTASTNSLKPLVDKFRETGTQIQSTTRELNALEAAGKENTTEYGQIRQRLRNLVDEYKVLDGQTKTYRETIRGIDSQLLDFGDTIDQVVSDKFRRLADIQELNITFDLNAEGLNEGLIEIERNFARSVQAINTQFEAQKKRIESGVGQTNASGEDLAEAQKNALRNVAVQRELALRQFKLQNDVFFAVNESLKKNLSSVFAPDNSEANKALEDRKNDLNSQSDLLKANLELGIISYQDYNSKILELEKERSDAIKEYDDSVKETRLNNLKAIAEDALPALNNQLLESQAELSVLLSESSASFTEVASKGLETIGVIAAQSLAIAVQQAKSLEEIEKLFVKNVLNGILRVLQAELIAATLKAIFKEGAEKGLLGLITGAIIGASFAVLFAQAEAKLTALLGYEQGGYTGNTGRKDVAGVVHGQEFVINADATKKNRPVLEWLNKTNGTFEQYIAKTSKETLSNDKFSVLNDQVLRNFDNRLSSIELQVADKNGLNVNNYIDTKSMSSSINGLAYTMDNRLASLETTVDKAIRQNATLTKSANQLDVSVYSDPGTAIKYMKKIGKIKGLS